MRMSPRLSPLFALALWALPLPAAAATELLMVEQSGCIYCERWHHDVGGEYALTDEGKAAPLRPIMLREMPPEGVQLQRPVVYTPTFVLLRDGVEAGRIEGYPGEDFFWGLLSGLLAETRRDPK